MLHFFNYPWIIYIIAFTIAIHHGQSFHDLETHFYLAFVKKHKSHLDVSVYYDAFVPL